MNFTCVDCSTKACRFGEYDRMPDNDACCTKTADSEELKALYNAEDIKIAHQAAKVEGSGRKTRLEETMEFACRMGYRKLGVGFCVGVSKEAKILVDILRENGFEVEAVSCKCGSINKSFIGIGPEDYVIKNRAIEIMCDPAAQAYLLCKKHCELCIILGLCVGHDTLFIRHCTAPVTVLSSKDRIMGNNPMAALYTADSYLSRVHTFVKDFFDAE